MAYVKNSIMIGSGGGGTTITVVANYSALPDPTTVTGQFYWAEASQGTSWLPGSLGGTYYNAGMYYSNGTSWSFVNVPYQATQAEVNAGVNTDKFVTPNTLAGWWTNIKTLAQTISGIWTWSNGTIFSSISNPTYAKGLVFYDANSESLAYYDDISGTTNNINYEQSLRARNNTGVTIPNGSVVYINGALGQNPTIALARANSITTCEVIGMATHDIANNSVGKVTTFGLVNDLDTSAFADGAMIYLSPTTAGLITSTVPSSPNFNVAVGVIAHSHVTQGKIFIHPSSPISLNTTLSTSNLFPVSENVVKTNLDSKQPKNIKAGYTQLTGVTGTQVLASLLIPANTYASGDGFEILMTPNKSVTASAITFAIYHDTSLNGVTNAIATGTNITTSNRTGFIHRFLVLDSTTLRNSMPASASSLIPIAGNTIGATTTFNPAVDNYITITVNPTVSSEVCGFNQLIIRLL